MDNNHELVYKIKGNLYAGKPQRNLSVRELYQEHLKV